jgi:hypothetical protein
MTLRDDTESENSAALQEVSHYALRTTHYGLDQKSS